MAVKYNNIVLCICNLWILAALWMMLWSEAEMFYLDLFRQFIQLPVLLLFHCVPHTCRILLRLFSHLQPD